MHGRPEFTQEVYDHWFRLMRSINRDMGRYADECTADAMTRLEDNYCAVEKKPGVEVPRDVIPRSLQPGARRYIIRCLRNAALDAFQRIKNTGLPDVVSPPEHDEYGMEFVAGDAAADSAPNPEQSAFAAQSVVSLRSRIQTIDLGRSDAAGFRREFLAMRFEHLLGHNDEGADVDDPAWYAKRFDITLGAFNERMNQLRKLLTMRHIAASDPDARLEIAVLYGVTLFRGLDNPLMES